MTDLNKILEELDVSKTKRYIKKPFSEDIEVLCRLQIGKSDSKHLLPNVAVLRAGEEYYFTNYKQNLPASNNLFAPEVNTTKIDILEAKTITTIVEGFPSFKEWHVTPYNYLVMSCFYSGIDLVGRGYIAV